jgi:hypothetical protein
MCFAELKGSGVVRREGWMRDWGRGFVGRRGNLSEGGAVGWGAVRVMVGVVVVIVVDVSDMFTKIFTGWREVSV